MSSAPAPAGIRGDAGSLRRRVTIAGIALIVLIIAADTYEGWQDYRRVIADHENLQVALSRAVTEQTARMVQEVDIALSSYAAWPAAGTTPEDNRTRKFLAQFKHLRFVHSA